MEKTLKICMIIWLYNANLFVLLAPSCLPSPIMASHVIGPLLQNHDVNGPSLQNVVKLLFVCTILIVKSIIWIALLQFQHIVVCDGYKYNPQIVLDFRIHSIVVFKKCQLIWLFIRAGQQSSLKQWLFVTIMFRKLM